MKSQKSKNNNWYVGYIFSRNINSNLIPQKVQNLVIRDFATRMQFDLKLSATEYKMNNSYLMLKSLNKKKPTYNGIIFYSFTMLLELKNYESLIISFLNNKIILFSALEEMSIKKKNDINLLKEIFYISKNIN
jgi:sporadic carbohydrate cluster protein (TIGR04323 family)